MLELVLKGRWVFRTWMALAVICQVFIDSHPHFLNSVCIKRSSPAPGLKHFGSAEIISCPVAYWRYLAVNRVVPIFLDVCIVWQLTINTAVCVKCFRKLLTRHHCLWVYLSGCRRCVQLDSVVEAGSARLMLCCGSYLTRKPILLMWWILFFWLEAPGPALKAEAPTCYWWLLSTIILIYTTI